jgi:hypothetical protein
VPGLNRIFSRAITVDIYNRGLFRPFINGFIDITPAYYGKRPKGL